MEKFKLACNDLQRVKELQPYNKQAQNAMARCLKFIKQDEGIDYTPKLDDMDLPQMEGIKTAEEQIREENQSKSSPITTPKAPEPPKVETPKVEPPKVEEVKPQEKKKANNFSELTDKLTKLKEQGNVHFKKQAFKEAIKQFSEAINAHEAAGQPVSDDNLKLVVTQLYTNRCLSFHNLN